MDEETQLREELGLCYRTLFKEGIYEGCDTHLSIALNDVPAFLTLPYGILWSDVQPNDFCLVGFDCQVIKESKRINQLTKEPFSPCKTAISIHVPIHQRLGNSRAKAVFHTHQEYATQLACSSKNYELQMIHQNSTRFLNAIIYNRQFTGLAFDISEGHSIADQFLVDQHLRILTQIHHGVFVIAPSASIAFDDTYFFEKACKIQVELIKMGEDPKLCAMSMENAKLANSQMIADSWKYYADLSLNARRQAEQQDKQNIQKKALNRPQELRQLIFPGFDQLVVPNILTLKPKNEENAKDLFDNEFFNQQLMARGHIILKNTGVVNAKDLSLWIPKLFKEQMSYKGGQCPRDNLGDGILNVTTSEPPHIFLAFHNELVYHSKFPSRIVFSCFEVAEVGGITTLMDNVKMSRNMPQFITDKLKKLGVMYYLNLQNQEAELDGREPKWYNNWQTSYRVQTKQEMEQVLTGLQYNFEWKKNDFLKIFYKNSGMMKYNGELLHLHQLIVSSAYYWDDFEQFNKLPLHDRPCHACWGDGSELSYEEEKSILAIQKNSQITIPYEQGDIFVLDNIMTCHGRTPFSGKRKVGAILGDMVERGEI